MTLYEFLNTKIACYTGLSVICITELTESGSTDLFKTHEFKALMQFAEENPHLHIDDTFCISFGCTSVTFWVHRVND